MEGEHLSVVTRGGEKPSETLILVMRMNVVVMTIMISQKELFFQSKSHLSFKLLVKKAVE